MQKAGKVVRIGKYPQLSENQNDVIEWIVLKEDTDTMLLISKYALITSSYCDLDKLQWDLVFLEWQTSLARENCMHFYKTAFSYEEKKCLISRKSKNGISYCSDYVFLLTEAEVNELLADYSLRKAKPSHYAIEKGARLGWTEDTREYTSWWIMPEIEETPGRQFSPQGLEYYNGISIDPKAVFQNGDIQFHSRNVYHKDFTIRPCILLNREMYHSMISKE